MSGGTLFWFAMYGICTLLFFGIAVVVAYRGISELRDLLKRDSRN